MTAAKAAAAAEVRFVLVTGKGGVGKSTVVTALARAHAKAGRRVLVALCNVKENVSKLLGCAPLDWQVRALAPNIWGVNMEPERCVEEYGAMTLHSKTLYSLLFDNRYVRTFLRAVPGLHEWSMLGKAWWHTTELLSGDTTDERTPPYGDGWKYETVIVDAPATGHGIDMLKVPRVLLDVAPGGPLRRDADRAWRLFQDPSHSGVVIVSLPEEMPANETIELAGAVRALGLPIPRLVVNALLPPLFAAGPRERLVEQAKDERLLPARARATRERIQQQALEKLASLGLPTTYLPFLVTMEPAEPPAISYLAKGL